MAETITQTGEENDDGLWDTTQQGLDGIEGVRSWR